jgi:hypothetical protein
VFRETEYNGQIRSKGRREEKFMKIRNKHKKKGRDKKVRRKWEKIDTKKNQGKSVKIKVNE